MGSTSHSPGQGERLLSIGERSIVALLDQRRQKEADIRDVVYVKPLGRGQHLVKNICNEQEFRVGTALANLTFTPGQMVQVSSHTGHPGEVIIGLPPVGQRGASATPIILHSRSYRPIPEPEVVPPGDPPDLLYAFYHDITNTAGFTDELYCYSYDGNGGSETLVAQRKIPGFTSFGNYGLDFDTLAKWAIPLSGGSLIFFKPDDTQHSPGGGYIEEDAAHELDRIYRWDAVSDTLSSVALTALLGAGFSLAGGLVARGSTLYFCTWSSVAGGTWKFRSLGTDLSGTGAVISTTIWDTFAGGMSFPADACWIAGSNYIVQTGTQRITFPLDGSTPIQTSPVLGVQPPSITGGALAEIGSYALIGQRTGTDGRWAHKVPGTDADMATFWPAPSGSSSEWHRGANTRRSRVQIDGDYAIACATLAWNGLGNDLRVNVGLLTETVENASAAFFTLANKTAPLRDPFLIGV